MSEETTTHKHTHKEQRRQYTFNKLKAFGQEIIEDIEKAKEFAGKCKKHFFN